MLRIGGLGRLIHCGSVSLDITLIMRPTVVVAHRREENKKRGGGKKVKHEGKKNPKLPFCVSIK